MKNSGVVFGTPKYKDRSISALCEIERLAWSSPGENIEANRQKIAKRIEIYPQGVSLALANRQPAGSQYSFRLNWNGHLDQLTTWDEMTHFGWVNEVHLPFGNTGFLVGVGVVPSFRGLKFQHYLGNFKPHKISELLIIYTLKKLFIDGIDRVIACARVPFKYQKTELTIKEYCQLQREDGQLFDPVLRFHKRLGASIVKPIIYSMEDTESQNAGCWVLYTKVPE